MEEKKPKYIQPIPWHRRHGVRISFYVLLQICLAIYLLVGVGVQAKPIETAGENGAADDGSFNENDEPAESVEYEAKCVGPMSPIVCAFLEKTITNCLNDPKKCKIANFHKMAEEAGIHNSAKLDGIAPIVQQNSLQLELLDVFVALTSPKENYKPCPAVDAKTVEDCGAKINIRDNELQFISTERSLWEHRLKICYRSQLGILNGTLENVWKLTKRFQLHPREYSSCQSTIQRQQKNKLNLTDGIWLEAELMWNNSAAILSASIFEKPMDISALMNGLFNGTINELLDYLFGKSSANIIENFSPLDFQNSLADGVFLDDFAVNGDIFVLKLDISMVLANDLADKNVSNNIWYSLVEPPKSELNNNETNAKFKECQARGVIDKDICLLNSTERPSGRFGIDETVNPNPTNANQTWGGKAVGPLPIPPKQTQDEEIAEAKYSIEVDPNEVLTEEEIRFLRENAKKKRGRRSKRDTDVEIECKDEITVDLRKDWPGCSQIIGTIRDQSPCESCWAVSTASALTDRACIALAKKRGKHISPSQISRRFASSRDLLECSYPKSKGCEGRGWPSKAWNYLSNDGTVNEMCKPYNPKRETNFDWEKNCYNKCDKFADDNGSLDLIPWGGQRGAKREGKSFDEISWDKKMTKEQWQLIKAFAGTLYKIVEHRALYDKHMEQLMMDEIKANGTIVVCFKVFEDFYRPKNPKKIYKYDKVSKFEGLHAVRLIGYGNIVCRAEDPDDTDPAQNNALKFKYWLMANSWGSKWNQDGIIRFRRGADECGIETKEVSFGTVLFPFDGL